MFKNISAVIDLGTNTFQFLIAGEDESGYHEIINIQETVKLGEGGINKGLIQPAAFKRGINAMVKFHELILNHDVKKVSAIATSALRSASNGQDFIDEVKTQTGISIQTIDGDKEAAYIYKGVKSAGCLSQKDSLIMDIGGGSVEFIIGNVDQIKWKQSFEIGCARLMDRFHRTDPIPPESITAVNLYLEDNVEDLFAAASKFSIENIIGSSGAFETYTEIIELAKGNAINLKKTKRYGFDGDELLSLIEKLVLSSHQQRLAMEGIIPLRVDMIVSAALITRFVMQKLGIYTVVMTTNSLKEGVLASMVS
ncbi:MAG TPA: exopolyphosphatase [Mucilaginibacter sp.]|jgi:exopolyphosphatase/guanosine-5'-triphosphate,3'-diphosphate pyrophosphatase